MTVQSRQRKSRPRDRAEPPGGSLRTESGHIPPHRRASLVDAVLDLPEVQESARPNVVFPLGDGETLHRLLERCVDVRVHPAGNSAIVQANLPFGAWWDPRCRSDAPVIKRPRCG
jgi:hypothetical protein